MPIPDLWQMLGYQNNATMFMEAFSGTSNTILTDNPVKLTISVIFKPLS